MEVLLEISKEEGEKLNITAERLIFPELFQICITQDILKEYEKVSTS